MRYRLWVFIACGLFVIGLAAGLIISVTMPSGIVADLSKELSSLGELGTILAPFKATTAIFIFFKNASTLLLSFILSPVLCLLPIIALAFNGLLISFISVIIAQKASLGFLLSGILPHGIFEIPALIMGEAASLSFGAMVIAAIFSRKRRPLLLTNLRQNLKFLLIAFVLLIPAAIIETYVTPLFLR